MSGSSEQNTATQEQKWETLVQELKLLIKGDLAGLKEALRESVEAFNSSLHAPPNYEQESVEADGSVVPYCDTDEYADFSAMEALVDAETTAIEEALLACAYRTHKKDDAAAKRRRNSLLRLLYLTLYIGRLETITDVGQIEESDRPTSDMEELKDEVGSCWVLILHEDGSLLSPEEREEWQYVVTAYLGPPFDAGL